MRSRLLTKISELDMQGEIYPTHRIIREDYEEEPEEFKYNTKTIFETTKTKENILCKPDTKYTYFKYFLDGSRRTYVIGYLSYSNKFLPIVAGQAGAACCERKEKKMKKTILDKQVYLLFPDVIENYELLNIRELVKKESPTEVIVDEYKYREVEGKPPVEFAIAKLNSLMQKKELGIVRLLTDSKMLTTDQLLVVDGSLQFQKPEGINFDNVIGVAKSYKTNLSGFTNPKKQLGVILKDLRFAERTPVLQVKERPIGFWFVRIRQKRAVQSPLDGILKVEMYTQGPDMMLDSSIVDNVTKFLVLERNPVCYGKDDRWQNLIYPIYVTEQLLKKSFLSDRYFINLF